MHTLYTEAFVATPNEVLRVHSSEDPAATPGQQKATRRELCCFTRPHSPTRHPIPPYRTSGIHFELKLSLLIVCCQWTPPSAYGRKRKLFSMKGYHSPERKTDPAVLFVCNSPLVVFIRTQSRKTPSRWKLERFPAMSLTKLINRFTLSQKRMSSLASYSPSTLSAGQTRTHTRGVCCVS